MQITTGLFDEDFPGAICASPDMDPEAWHSDDLTLQDIAVELCGYCIHGPNGDGSCLDLAIRLDSQAGHAWGVWGGVTARERQLLIDEEDGDSGI